MNISTVLTEPASGWATPCCGRSPAAIAAHRYVCRGCGRIYVDSEWSIRRAFGDGVERVITPPRRFTRVEEDDGIYWLEIPEGFE